MQFRSCKAVHRPDLKNKPCELQEGEYCFGTVVHKGYEYKVLYCKLPEEGFGLHSLPLNANEKDSGRASWGWDGNIETPTLSPSIGSGPKDDRLWHGYLKQGSFNACE